jgi:hypothetical protein
MGLALKKYWKFAALGAAVLVVVAALLFYLRRGDPSALGSSVVGNGLLPNGTKMNGLLPNGTKMNGTQPNGGAAPNDPAQNKAQPGKSPEFDGVVLPEHKQ